jgi:MacB-like protein
MPSNSRHPFAVSVGYALIRIAARIVPFAQRDDWKREWRAEIWHRWQFLFHTREWNRREQRRLVISAAGAFLDAAWLLASQDAVKHRARELARSPFSSLFGLAAVLLLIAAASSGLPATRELLFEHSFDGPNGRLAFVWLHPFVGGGDKGLPADVEPAWASHSRLINGASRIVAFHRTVSTAFVKEARPLVVSTDNKLLPLLGAKPAVGRFPQGNGVVLSYSAWVSLMHADPAVLGAKIAVGGTDYTVAAVLPASFHFLSRQATVYLVQQYVNDRQVFAVLRVKPGVTEHQLDKELTKIAEDACYYFFSAQLRFGFWNDALLTPLRVFGVAALVAALIAAIVFRFRFRYVGRALEAGNRKPAAQRALFFAAKTALALACVFVGCLEWSRSDSAVLLASRDPGSGPFLLWLYILGAMGVLFWAVADQRARCRVCLRLLAFPVRIGCPGCLLLDWSGTELFCSEGHGVLHVPHMAPSWDEGSERWISLDESWRGLFAHEE